MKTDPTDIDREAARLFECVDGMRAGWCYTSVTVVPPRNRCLWERIRSDSKSPDAIDTDDPATVGVMLAQVRRKAPGLGTGVLHLRPLPTTNEPGRWAVISCGTPLWFGPTEGAALVAAMKAIKGAA